MYATYTPQTDMLETIYDVLQQGTVTDEKAKALTILYMSTIYSNPIIGGNASAIIEEVNYKRQFNETFKQNYNFWLDIFKSIVSRAEV